LAGAYSTPRKFACSSSLYWPEDHQTPVCGVSETVGCGTRSNKNKEQARLQPLNEVLERHGSAGEAATMCIAGARRGLSTQTGYFLVGTAGQFEFGADLFEQFDRLRFGLVLLWIVFGVLGVIVCLL